MTPLLQQVIHFLKEKPEGVRIVRRTTDQERLDPPLEEEATPGHALLVPERDRPSNELSVMPVPPGEEATPFTHFLDGIQHAHLLYYLCTEQGFLPVVYGYIAAMVLERRERRLYPLQDFWMQEEALYLPERLVNTSTLKRRGIPVHDTCPEGISGNFSFASLILKAGGTIARIRDQLERRLALQWIGEYGSSRDKWLMVDGSISDILTKMRSRRHVQVVGVSKTHHTAYFSGEWLNRIYSLKAGERSSLFRPMRPKAEEVYSWYLRLRWQEGAPPTYGLVRLEMPPTPETLQSVDQVSAWLLQEARPLSLPDARYDRLLYPFRMCEQYLRSRAPSPLVIESAVACLQTE